MTHNMNLIPAAYVKKMMQERLKKVDKNKLSKVWTMLEDSKFVDYTRHGQDFIQDLKSSPLKHQKFTEKELDKLNRRYGKEPYYRQGVQTIQSGDSIARCIQDVLSPTKDLNPLAKMNSGGVRKLLRFMKDAAELRGEKTRIELKGRVAKSSKSTKVLVGDQISKTRFTGMFPTNNLVRGDRTKNGKLRIYEDEIVKGDSGVFSVKVWRHP